jgi:ADP-heptose:LPS heptosyltransferase
MRLRVGIKMLGFRKTYTLSFKHEIPNFIPVYLKQTSLIFRWFKYTKRQLFLRLKRQARLELDEIMPTHNYILWINISAPSLGDSLMDLSSRILLKERNIDLFTNKKNAGLYRSDKVFRNIYTSENKVNPSQYDLVVIDSYSTRSINIKAKIAPLIPFVGLYGYFNGPEVNRVLFSFHRLNQLLDYSYSKSEINAIARASIEISTADKVLIHQENLPSNYITIAIGGEWAHRTYNNWRELIDKLIKKNSEINLVFVGSENAKESAQALTKSFPQDNIFNFVAKFTFSQTVQIIKGSNILLCCDGGLMHSANAVKTPIVPLFARLPPIILLTDPIKAFPLFDDTDVNNISAEDIVLKYLEAINSLNNHPEGE